MSDLVQPERIATQTPAPEKTPRTGGTYVVKKGDMLSVISQRELGTSRRWREIVALNPGIRPDRLFVGARLKMPELAPGARDERSLVAQSEVRPARGQRYTVR